jgi:decaprenylphospho-beta-D-ribofuranose 2-oxidase
MGRRRDLVNGTVPTGGATWSGRELVRGWGRNTGSRARVVAPADAGAWQDLFRSAGARGLIARGAGSGYGDCAQNAGGYVARTGTSAGHTVDDATSTVSVDAGALLADLMADLVPRGWALPVLPGTAHVSVGGAIAADIHGKNHPSAGSIGTHIVEAALLTPAFGEITIGPDSRPEVYWATVGGLGLTGVIRHARIRLRPVDTAWMWCQDTVCDDLDAVLAGLHDAHARDRYAVAWLDGYATAGRLGRGVLSVCWPAALEELPRDERARPLAYPSRRSMPIPSLPGPGVIHGPAVRAANALHLAGARRRGRSWLRPINAALHPLDVTRGWPGLYGQGGLVQYQFGIPFGAEAVLGNVLTRAAGAGCPPSLAVLKQFGAANPAPLSFPGPGWTLALDFPARTPALAGLLDDVDAAVAAAGGRVYLVKDSRLRPDLLTTMYPGLDAWREVRAQVDPTDRLRSDLSRRLRLAG